MTHRAPFCLESPSKRPVPALIEGARSAVSDGQGVFTIVDLRPGPYVVTFTLAGFRTLRREGIVLPAQFTATVNAELALGELEETITVAGEVPIVDIRSTRAQVQFEKDTLEALPGAGRLAILSAVLPGATLMRETDRSVGGLNDRGQNTFYIHGTPESQPIVDGFNVMMHATQGLIVYNQLTLQEVVVETSGAGADRDTGALLMNLVSKDGGNRFSGSAMFASRARTWRAATGTRSSATRGEGGDREIAQEVPATSGGRWAGRSRRDRFWFFGAFREGVNQHIAQGLYYNKLRQPDSFLFEPDCREAGVYGRIRARLHTPTDVAGRRETQGGRR